MPDGDSTSSELESLRDQLLAQIENEASPLHQGTETRGVLQTTVRSTEVAPSAAVRLTELPEAHEGRRAVVRDGWVTAQYAVALTTQPRQNCEKFAACSLCESDAVSSCAGLYSTYDPAEVVVTVDGTISLGGQQFTHYEVLDPPGGQLTFTSTDWHEPQVVTVAVHPDRVDAGAAYLGGLTHVSVSADSFYNDPFTVYEHVAHTSPAMDALAVDADRAAVAVEPHGASHLGEGSHGADVFVTLDSRPLAPVTLSAVPLGGAFEAVATGAGAVTVAPGAWNDTHAVALRATSQHEWRAAEYDVRVRFDASAPGDARYTGNASVVGFEDGRAATALRVTDDEWPAVLVAAPAARPDATELGEGAGAASVAVRLTSMPRDDVTVTAAAAATAFVDAGGALAVTPAALVFSRDDWQAPRSFAVSAPNDETFRGIDHVAGAALRVGSTDPRYRDDVDGAAASGALAVALPAARWFEAAVRDNDDPLLAADARPASGAGLEVTEGAAAGTVGVRLASAPLYDVVVDAALVARSGRVPRPAAASGAPLAAPDATLSPSRLVFTAATWNETQELALGAPRDRVDDDGGPAQRWRLALRATSADPAYDEDASGAPAHTTGAWLRPGGRASALVRDLDEAGVVVSVAADTPTEAAGRAVLREGAAGPATALRVALASRPLRDVEVTLAVGDEAELEATRAAVRFSPWDLGRERAFALLAEADAVDRGASYVSALALATSSQDAAYDDAAAAVEPAGATAVAVNVTDDDAAGLSVLVDAATAATRRLREGAGTAAWEVVLESEPAGAAAEVVFAVDVGVRDRLELWTAEELTFTPLDWFAPQRVAISGKMDDVDRGHRVGAEVTHAVASDADPRFVAAGAVQPPKALAVRVVDAQEAGVTVTLGETGRPVVRELGREDFLHVALHTQPLADVVVRAHVEPAARTHVRVCGADAVVCEGLEVLLTFTAADWRAPQRVRTRALLAPEAEARVQQHSVGLEAASADPQYGTQSEALLRPAPEVVVAVVDLPTLSHVVPVHGPAAGAEPGAAADAPGVIHVYGSNFGLEDDGAEVLVENAPCAETTWVSDTHLVCHTPPGVGADLRVVVRKGEQRTQQFVTYSYDEPMVFAVDPLRLTTDGGEWLRVIGVNFGTASGWIDWVRVRDKFCTAPQLMNDNELRCLHPEGVAAGHVVAVQVRDRVNAAVNRECPAYAYALPVVTRVSNCSALDTATRAVDCDTLGGDVLHVEGRNFGVDGIAVTVGARACAVLEPHDHNFVRCVTPPGVGFDVPVVVHVEGQRSAPGRMSYRPPSLAAGQWFNVSASGKEPIRILGADFGATAEDGATLGVLIGGHPCLDHWWEGPGAALCITPPGIGQREAVRLYVSGQASPDADAVLSYVPYVLNVHPYVAETGTEVRVLGEGFVDTGADLACCFGFDAAVPAGAYPSARGRCVNQVPAAFVSANEVRCIVPALPHVPRTRLVVEVSADGGRTFGDDGKENIVEYAPAVVLTALDPPNGPVQGGGWLQITGLFFRASRLLRCRVGGVTLDTLGFEDPDVVWVSPHEVLCRVPEAAAPGPAAVSVSNDDGQHFAPALTYLYQGATAARGLEAHPWTLEFGGNPVVVAGDNFSDAFPARLRCRFGISSSHAVYLGPGRVRCQPPPFDYLREWPSTELSNAWAPVRVSNDMEAWGEGPATIAYALPCRYGYYCPQDDAAAAAYAACARGQACAGNASWPEEPALLPCPAGHFCPQDNLFRPMPCPRGTYQPRRLQGTCLPCPDGFYCPDEGMAAPAPCPPGFVCDAASALNETQYNVFPAKSRAALVDVGLVQPGELCPGGHFCGSGMRSADADRANLEACPVSFPRETCTKEHTGAAAPNTCDDAYYCTPGSESGARDDRPQNVTAKQQNTCFAGFECPVGSVRPQGVRACEKGYYCPGYVRGFSTVPKVNCERGNYCPLSGMVAPLQCPPGQYNPVERALECRVCSPGFTCPPTDPSAQTGLIAQVSCRAGWVCNAPGLPLPLRRCPAGYYCSGGTASEDVFSGDEGAPQPCPAGVYCLAGVVSPERNRSGTLTEVLVTQKCSKDPGTCQRASEWVLDLDTTMVRLTASAFPSQCLPGSYCGRNSSTPQGSGSCWPGHFCPAAKALVNLPNSDELIETYASLMGFSNTTLFECKDKQTCDLLPGTQVPIKARRGHFAEAEGNSLDSPCFPGFFADEEGQPTCDPCTPGFQCPTYRCDGAICPLPCDAGFVCEEEGIARQATPCPAGYYCNPATNTSTPLYDPRSEQPPRVQVPLMVRRWNGSEPYHVPPRPVADANGTLLEDPFPLLFNLSELPPPPDAGFVADAYWDVGSALVLGGGGGAQQSTLQQQEPFALAADGGGACFGNHTEIAMIVTGQPEEHPHRVWQPWVDYVVEVEVASANASAAVAVAWFANATDHYRFVLAGAAQPDGPCAYFARYGGGRLHALANWTLLAPALAGLPLREQTVVKVRANATLGEFRVYINGEEAAVAIDGVLRGGGVGVGARGGPVEVGRWYVYDEELFNTSISKAPVPCPSATFCLDGTKYGDFPTRVENAGTEFERVVYEREGDSDFPQPCTEGYYCLEGTDTPQGRDAEGQCEAGNYCPKASPLPIPARLGYYVPLPGRSSDTACPAGRYADVRGLADCSLCPAGSYCFSATNESGTIYPIPCPKGTYKDEANRESRLCLECPAGRFRDEEGGKTLDSCTLTPAGMVCASTGLTDTPSFLRSAQGAVAGVLNSVCELCSEGFFCPSGTDKLDDPKRCPEGYFCGEATTAQNVFNNEQRCEPGFVCEKGTFESNKQLTKCKVNHFCRTQQSAPTPCPPGTTSVLASEDVDACLVDPTWLNSNGRRVVSVNPGYPDSSRGLDPLAYDHEQFMWANPPALLPEEATFELAVNGFEQAHIMLNFSRNPATMRLLHDGVLMYDRDFRIAIYEGAAKEERAQPAAPESAKAASWTQALDEFGVQLDVPPYRPYIEGRGDCEWCLAGAPMPPKNITFTPSYAPTDAALLNLRSSSRVYFRKWVSVADYDGDRDTYVSELHHTPVSHYSDQVDRSALLREDRSICLSYCSRVRDWLGANAAGGNADWLAGGIGYGNSDLFRMSENSEYDGVRRLELPKSFRRASGGGYMAITEEARSNLFDGTLHFTVMARRNSTLFLEIEIMNGLFYDRAFQLFGNTLSWAKEGPARTGTVAENPERAEDNGYSFLALLSQDINAAQTRLPLNLNNFYDHTTEYVTTGETLYLRNETEVRIGRGEQELLFGFLNAEGYGAAIAGDAASTPPNEAPALLRAGEYGLTEPDPVGSPPAVQDSIRWESADFWKDKAIIATAYLPYVSNCAGYDSYVPLFKLFENPNCTLPPAEETTPTNIAALSEANNTDACELVLTCRYEEDFDQAKVNWFQTIAPQNRQFYFTRQPWSLRDYDPKFQLRKSEWVVQDLRENTAREIEDTMSGLAHDRVPVLPLNKEIPPNNAYPKRVLLDIGYYQKSATYKEIATATLAFEEYEAGDPANPPEYEFIFTFHALSIQLLIDNFSLPLMVFISITIMLGLFLLGAISGLWITGRRKSKVLPIPSVDPRQYFRMIAIPAVQGFSFAMAPILFTLAILFLIFYSNGDITLDFLSPFSGSRRVFYELGETEKTTFRIQRWGLVFVTMGTYGLAQATRALVPVPKHELQGLNSPRLWFRTHLRLCYFVYLLVQSSVLVFTRSPTFKENVIMWTMAIKVLQQVVSQLLQRALPDKLLFISFQMSTETIMKTMSLGVATFINFLIQYIGQLAGAIFNRALKTLVMQYVSSMQKADEEAEIDAALTGDEKRKPPRRKALKRFLFLFLPPTMVYQLQEREREAKKRAVEMEERNRILDNEYKRSAVRHQELAMDDLYMSSVLFVSQMLGPVFTTYVFLFAPVLGIETAFGQFDLQFYVLFGMLMLTFQFMFDLLLQNFVEAYYGWNINKYLVGARERFAKRTHRWVLLEKDDKEAYRLRKDLRLLDKMGFSSQFYFVAAFATMSVLLFAFGGMIIITRAYNPFLDNYALPLILYVIAFCRALHVVIFRLGDTLGIWLVKPKTEQEDEEDEEDEGAKRRQSAKRRDEVSDKHELFVELGSSDDRVTDFRQQVRAFYDMPDDYTSNDIAIQLHRYMLSKLPTMRGTSLEDMENQPDFARALQQEEAKVGADDLGPSAPTVAKDGIVASSAAPADRGYEEKNEDAAIVNMLVPPSRAKRVLERQKMDEQVAVKHPQEVLWPEELMSDIIWNQGQLHMRRLENEGRLRRRARGGHRHRRRENAGGKDPPPSQRSGRSHRSHGSHISESRSRSKSRERRKRHDGQ